MDNDSTHLSGRYILNTDFKDPVLFISGMTLDTGEVVAYEPEDGYPIILFHSGNPTLVEDYKFLMCGEEYHFKIHEDQAGKYQYELFLTKNSDKQTLIRFNNTQYDFVILLWIGDLDNDKRPDIYMNAISEPWKSVYRLFLSSVADSNSMVKEAAIFKCANE